MSRNEIIQDIKVSGGPFFTPDDEYLPNHIGFSYGKWLSSLIDLNPVPSHRVEEHIHDMKEVFADMVIKMES